MLKDTTSTHPPDQESSSGEIIGLLTAISIVSKRMAHRLALLDQRTATERGDTRYGRADDAAGAAGQSHAI